MTPKERYLKRYRNRTALRERGKTKATAAPSNFGTRSRFCMAADLKPVELPKVDRLGRNIRTTLDSIRNPRPKSDEKIRDRAIRRYLSARVLVGLLFSAITGRRSR